MSDKSVASDFDLHGIPIDGHAAREMWRIAMHSKLVAVNAILQIICGPSSSSSSLSFLLPIEKSGRSIAFVHTAQTNTIQNAVKHVYYSVLVDPYFHIASAIKYFLVSILIAWRAWHAMPFEIDLMRKQILLFYSWFSLLGVCIFNLQRLR